jgi:hypothetical protein
MCVSVSLACMHVSKQMNFICLFMLWGYASESNKLYNFVPYSRVGGGGDELAQNQPQNFPIASYIMSVRVSKFCIKIIRNPS